MLMLMAQIVDEPASFRGARSPNKNALSLAGTSVSKNKVYVVLSYPNNTGKGLYTICRTGGRPP